jgi:hypothetical protein
MSPAPIRAPELSSSATTPYIQGADAMCCIMVRAASMLGKSRCGGIFTLWLKAKKDSYMLFARSTASSGRMGRTLIPLTFRASKVDAMAKHLRTTCYRQQNCTSAPSQSISTFKLSGISLTLQVRSISENPLKTTYLALEISQNFRNF